ncbi:MAG: efflux RND transporter periplasmic adaptor subunit [Bacteroidales bacterium]|nr:MAG: efflux RND transporter periplasmic adaptor subunit [Bacteroidales bacterium]
MNYFKYLLIVLSLAFWGCSQNHTHTEEEAHSHESAEATHSHAEEGGHSHEGIELEKVQYTAYSSDFELFAEADIFIVDKPAGILSHFTFLQDFKPLEEGVVVAKLIIGGKEYTQTLEKPTRKGIYSFTITPKSAGKGQLIFDIKSSRGNSQVIINDVSVYECAHSASEAHQHEEQSTVNTISFTKEQSWKIEFATETPVVQPFGQVIKTTAKVVPAASDELIITAKAKGVVQMSTGAVLAGTIVKSGSALFTIGATGIADENSAVVYTEAKNNYEKAKADYNRAQELAKDKIISDKDLQQYKVDYENAKVHFESISSNYNVSGFAVKSSIDGFVSQVYVSNGQFVEVGQPLVSIIKNKNIYLKADVQAKYASVLGAIKSANIRVLPNKTAFTLEELNGKVVSFGKSTEADGFLVPVTLQVENNGSFVSGSFAEVYLKTETSKQALTIPTSAILEEQGTFTVLVQINPELFEKREVKVGATDGLRTEILSGISATDRVATKGAILVKLAQASGALDPHAGHVH